MAAVAGKLTLTTFPCNINIHMDDYINNSITISRIGLPIPPARMSFQLVWCTVKPIVYVYHRLSYDTRHLTIAVYSSIYRPTSLNLQWRFWRISYKYTTPDARNVMHNILIQMSKSIVVHLADSEVNPC